MHARQYARRIAAFATPLALALAAPQAAHAQYMDNGLHAGTLEIPVNKSQVISADRPIAKVLVGNEEIADIVALTDRSIYVLGKSMGTTSLTLYDRGGRVLSVMDIAVGPDAEAFRSQAARLLPGSEIDAHISGDSLVLTGLASDVGTTLEGGEIDENLRLAPSANDEVRNNAIFFGGGGTIAPNQRDPNKSASSLFELRLIVPNDGEEAHLPGQRAHVRIKLEDESIVKQAWRSALQLIQSQTVKG